MKVLTFTFNNGKNCRQTELEDETLEEALTILLKKRRKYKNVLYHYMEGDFNEKPRISVNGIATWEEGKLSNQVIYFTKL